MNFDTFQANALVTESKPESLTVNPQAVFTALSFMYESAKLMDLLKKTIFYGRDMSKDDWEQAVLRTGNSLMAFSSFAMGNLRDMEVDHGYGMSDAEEESDPKTPEASMFNLRLLHAFIGDFTESGELVDAYLQSLISGKPIDLVNVGEEYADKDWYKAIAFDELGLSEQGTRSAVIAKLKKRYGDKFSAAAASNRDLAGERQILEAGI